MLTETGTGTVRTGITSNNGEYQFSQLLPGRYELAVSAQGFASVKRTAIELLAGC
jgi:protocatechuate 3,4-dioxygenase beta subunit